MSHPSRNAKFIAFHKTPSPKLVPCQMNPIPKPTTYILKIYICVTHILRYTLNSLKWSLSCSITRSLFNCLNYDHFINGFNDTIIFSSLLLFPPHYVKIFCSEIWFQISKSVSLLWVKDKVWINYKSTNLILCPICRPMWGCKRTLSYVPQQINPIFFYLLVINTVGNSDYWLFGSAHFEVKMENAAFQAT